GGALVYRRRGARPGGARHPVDEHSVLRDHTGVCDEPNAAGGWELSKPRLVLRLACALRRKDAWLVLDALRRRRGAAHLSGRGARGRGRGGGHLLPPDNLADRLRPAPCLLSLGWRHSVLVRHAGTVPLSLPTSIRDHTLHHRSNAVGVDGGAGALSREPVSHAETRRPGGDPPGRRGTAADRGTDGSPEVLDRARTPDAAAHAAGGREADQGLPGQLLGNPQAPCSSIAQFSWGRTVSQRLAGRDGLHVHR